MDDSYHSHLRVSLLNLLGPSNPIWSCASAQTHPEATKFRRGIRESVKKKDTTNLQSEGTATGENTWDGRRRGKEKIGAKCRDEQKNLEKNKNKMK